MTAKRVWIEAIIQRPVIRLRTSSSASRSDSSSKRPASSALWPIVLPSRIPRTESDSCTSDEIEAIDSCRIIAMRRRCSPTFVSQTKTGSSASEKSVEPPVEDEHRDHGRDAPSSRSRPPTSPSR